MLVRRAASFVLNDSGLHLNSDYDIVDKYIKTLTQIECFAKIEDEMTSSQEK